MDAHAQQLFGDLAPVLRNQWSRFQVKRAWLFGSRSGQRSTSRSDWDFLVEFQQAPNFDTFMGLKLDLEKRLHGHVDLLSRSACSPRFLSAIEDDLIDVT